MKILTRSLLTLSALAAPVLALPQETAPAQQLEKFHTLVGRFEGGGTFVPMPGMEALPWTATATGSLTLGGHVVQLDEVVQTPMGPMHFRTLYGWDSERSLPVSYWVGSMGVGTADLNWADDKTLIAMNHGTEEGQPYAERATTTLTEGGYSFRMERFDGQAPAYVKVSGEMKRVAKEPSVASDAAASTPGEAMAKLAPMLGSWSLTGAINMMGTEMDITGTETTEWIFGGAAMAGHIVGQPGDYQSDWYIAHDAEAGCYRHVYASNMGEIGMATGYLKGDQMIFTEAGQMMGEPMVSRSVVQFANGAIASVWADAITGSADPVRSFQATYQRAGAKPVSLFTPGSCCAKAEAAGGACKHPCCVTAAEAGEVCQRCNK